MGLLFAARGGRVPIPGNARALAGTTSAAHKVIRILLERGGDDIQINEEAVNVAVQNSSCGAKTLEIFLDKSAEDVPLTDEIVRLAAGNDGCGDEIVSLLLEERGDDVRITREVLLTAAHNPKRGHKVMAAIFDTLGLLDKEGDQFSEAIETSLYEACEC
ncbi:hypothetical protein K4K57_009403 [Colletotrichum sp. SAR 10_99]|nr:hypothetical protein K4K57_009403 [Colletotrichum sp. SAR 10_99]